MDAPTPITFYPFNPTFSRRTARHLRVCNIAGIVGLIVFGLGFVTLMFGMVYGAVASHPDAVGAVAKTTGAWTMGAGFLLAVLSIMTAPNVTEFNERLTTQYDNEIDQWTEEIRTREWRVERPSWDDSGNLTVDLIHPDGYPRPSGVFISGARYRVSLVASPPDAQQSTLCFTEVWHQLPDDADKTKPPYQALICFAGAVIITTPNLELYQCHTVAVPTNGGEDSVQLTEYLKP